MLTLVCIPVKDVVFTQQQHHFTSISHITCTIISCAHWKTLWHRSNFKPENIYNLRMCVAIDVKTLQDIDFLHSSVTIITKFKQSYCAHNRFREVTTDSDCAHNRLCTQQIQRGHTKVNLMWSSPIDKLTSSYLFVPCP